MDIFEFHTGFDVREKKTGEGEKVYETDCPFCGKEKHFHYFDNTQWGCKVCGRKGNNYTFIGLLYEQLCIGDIAKIAIEMSLPQSVMQKNGIRLNRLNGTYVIPTYNHEGKMNNLYKYIPKDSRSSLAGKILGSPGIPSTLFNWHEVTEDEIWICEGQKDKLAGDAIIGSSRPVTVTGLPGANMFRESFAGYLRDKKVVFFFDNDQAGEDGLDRTLNIIRETPQKPKEIWRVEWPDDAPKGFDLRDFYIEHGRKSYALLQPLINKVEDQTVVKVTTENIIEDFSCDSYDKALDHFEKAFHTTSDMRTALATVMASIYSLNIDGEQLWVKIIGSPGTGKTRIAKAVSASDYVVSKSTFTGLFSGWREGGDDKDAGMIPLISGRTLIVKDADALLRQKDIERIMSELRDFYDKDSSVSYRNKTSYDYRNIRSTIIICGTQVLRRADQSFLGERFLSCEMDVTEADEEAIKRKAMQRNIEVALGQTKDPEIQIMSSMKGWINHLRDRKLDSTIPQEFQEIISQLCSLTALMRTKVDRNIRGRLESPAMPEMPTRLIGQIIVATLSLCAVFGRNQPDNEIYLIIRKLLRDTINPRSHRFMICDTLMECPGISGIDLLESFEGRIHQTTLYEEMQDLIELGYVKATKIPSSTPGRKRLAYTLAPKIANPFKLLG